MNLYGHEKVRELEERRRAKRIVVTEQLPRRQPVFGPLAKNVGSTLRRLGEGLEAWAGSPQPRSDDTPLGLGER